MTIAAVTALSVWNDLPSESPSIQAAWIPILVNLLAPFFRQLLCNGSCNNIGRTTGTEGNDQTHRACREGLSIARDLDRIPVEYILGPIQLVKAGAHGGHRPLRHRLWRPAFGCVHGADGTHLAHQEDFIGTDREDLP